MKIRKELWFGFILMGLILAGIAVVLLRADTITSGHLGLLMLALVVVAIMLGFPTAFTLMGMGMIFTWLAYDRDTAQDARPDGAGGVQGDEQRRADLDPAVRLHGLPGRARQPDREAVPQPAPGAGARAGLAGGGHAVHLRGVRHRHRHRRRGGHADGPARVAADAQGRLRRQAVGRRHHRRRLPGHPDPAVGAADRLRRHRRRVGGAAVRRRVLPRPDAGRPVHRLRDHRWPSSSRSLAPPLSAERASCPLPAPTAARRRRGRRTARCRRCWTRSRAAATSACRPATCSASWASRCCRRCCSRWSRSAATALATDAATRADRAAAPASLGEPPGAPAEALREAPASRRAGGLAGAAGRAGGLQEPPGAAADCRSRRARGRRAATAGRGRRRAASRRRPQRRHAAPPAAERATAARPASGSAWPSALAALVGVLRAAELPAARSLQDAAGLVLPAGGADPGGAGLDRVRAWPRRPRRRRSARSAASCWRRPTGS